MDRYMMSVRLQLPLADARTPLHHHWRDLPEHMCFDLRITAQLGIRRIRTTFQLWLRIRRRVSCVCLRLTTHVRSLRWGPAFGHGYSPAVVVVNPQPA